MRGNGISSRVFHSGLAMDWLEVALLFRVGEDGDGELLIDFGVDSGVRRD